VSEAASRQKTACGCLPLNVAIRGPTNSRKESCDEVLESFEIHFTPKQTIRNREKETLFYEERSHSDPRSMSGRAREHGGPGAEHGLWNWALANNSGGVWNSAFGAFALEYNTSGSNNTATGANTLGGTTAQSVGTGGYNTADGANSLQNITSGSENTAVGSYSLPNNSEGFGNAAVGYYALSGTTTGSYNTAIGPWAGYYGPAGANWNIDIGNYGSSSNSSRVIRIGMEGVHTSFYAAGVDGVSVSGGVPVYINSNGQLGTVNSSVRYKEDVRDMGEASSAIFRLRPVTYHYKQAYADSSKPIDYGLIAEEVAEVYPDLVVKGADGQIQTVQYQKLTPMLLNEVQKEHRLVEQMEKTMQQQQETMAQQQAIQLLKTQQTETVQLLEKRLAALEGQASARLEAKVAMQ